MTLTQVLSDRLKRCTVRRNVGDQDDVTAIACNVDAVVGVCLFEGETAQQRETESFPEEMVLELG